MSTHPRQRSFCDILHRLTSRQLHTPPELIMHHVEHEFDPSFAIVLQTAREMRQSVYSSCDF